MDTAKTEKEPVGARRPYRARAMDGDLTAGEQRRIQEQALEEKRRRIKEGTWTKMPPGPAPGVVIGYSREIQPHMARVTLLVSLDALPADVTGRRVSLTVEGSVFEPPSPNGGGEE